MPQNRNSKHSRSSSNNIEITDPRILADKLQYLIKNYRYKQNEIFKRMKITTFVQLALQVNAIQKLEDEARLKSAADTARSELMTPASQDGESRESPVPSLALTEGDYGDVKDTQTPRSTLQSVIRGVGEFDLEEKAEEKSPPKEPEPFDDSCPYLLLDIREKEAFDECHIITAIHYPAAMLSRSYNNFSSTPQIITYRNKPGKIILIYDEDERAGTAAATTFAERGFDNLFLLSGGLKVAYQKFPEGLITGTLPQACLPQQPPSTSRSKKKPPPIEKRPVDRSEFNEDDLDKLSTALDQNLVPQDSGSRLSRASTRASSNASNSTVNTARSTTSTIHSSPWK
ncbi:centrosomal protein of 41 kDa-like isoform X2 [Ptychodera flava]|uniref:centrosomal protein of 41 kDa-like isoform X2 n=1 Tax=Ptychodera flava TaxID=63121 RepID=UPI00396A7EB0